MKVTKEARPRVCSTCGRTIRYKQGITVSLLFEKRDGLFSTTGCCPICVLKWVLTSLGFDDEETERMLREAL